MRRIFRIGESRSWWGRVRWERRPSPRPCLRSGDRGPSIEAGMTSSGAANSSAAPYGFVDAYRPKSAGKRPLVVLDEIHKYPRWKTYVKGLWDTRKERADLLVTGSARLDVYQRGGDSLLGRYHQYRLHPLSVREITDPDKSSSAETPEKTMKSLLKRAGPAPAEARRALKGLLRWGGFPEPFLERSERQHRLWLRERRNLIVKEDLRDLTHIQMLSHVEELIELLVLRAGGVLSYNALREELQVAVESVRQWTNHLQRLYFLYLIRPFVGNIARSLRKEPKLYLWDWSEVEESGARFENLVAGHLLKCATSRRIGVFRLSIFTICGTGRSAKWTLF